MTSTTHVKRFSAIKAVPCLAFAIFIFLVACTKSSGNSKSPSTDTAQVIGTFRVQDSKIVDTVGIEFIAKGVNVNGPYWPWTRSTITDSNLISNTWLFNLIRVNCWPIHPPYPNTNNVDLDAIVKTFTDKKIVVLIEDHSFTGSYPSGSDLSDAITWWTALANKYKNNRYVWFNVMNEPGNGGAVPQTWLDTHEAIISAIRQTGSGNIIVCDEHAYGQANGFDNPSSSAALVYGTTLTSKYSNIVFSLHLYDQWIYGSDRLNNYIDAVQAKKLALIIGEYGVASNYSAEVASEMFKVINPKKIGRVTWHWVGEDIHQLSNSNGGGGWSVDNTSGAKPGNLSFAGNLVWLDNHNQLQITDPGLIPPPVILANPNFEVGSPVNGSSNIDGWINFGTASLDSMGANVKQGTYSLEIAAGSSGGCGQTMYLQPGGTYTMTAWGKNSQVANNNSIVGLKYSATFSGSQSTIAELDFTENSYQQKSVTFTAPAQIGSLFLYIYKNDPIPSFWVDDIKIVKQ